MLALRFVTKTRGLGRQSPFTTIRAGNREEQMVSSNDSVFYYYAEGGELLV